MVLHMCDSSQWHKVFSAPAPVEDVHLERGPTVHFFLFDFGLLEKWKKKKIYLSPFSPSPLPFQCLPVFCNKILKCTVVILNRRDEE